MHKASPLRPVLTREHSYAGASSENQDRIEDLSAEWQRESERLFDFPEHFAQRPFDMIDDLQDDVSSVASSFNEIRASFGSHAASETDVFEDLLLLEAETNHCSDGLQASHSYQDDFMLDPSFELESQVLALDSADQFAIDF